MFNYTISIITPLDFAKVFMRNIFSNLMYIYIYIYIYMITSAGSRDEVASNNDGNLNSSNL